MIVRIHQHVETILRHPVYELWERLEGMAHTLLDILPPIPQARILTACISWNRNRQGRGHSLGMLAIESEAWRVETDAYPLQDIVRGIQRSPVISARQHQHLSRSICGRRDNIPVRTQPCHLWHDGLQPARKQGLSLSSITFAKVRRRRGPREDYQRTLDTSQRRGRRHRSFEHRNSGTRNLAQVGSQL